MPTVLSRKAGGSGGGGAPSGPAGGALSGTYPNPTIAAGAVTPSMLQDPVAVVHGAPTTAFEFNTSSLTGLTAMGTPADESANTDVPGHYYVRVNANASFAAVGRYAAAPAVPWTAITCSDGTFPRDDFNATGFFVGDSTPGAMITINVNRAVRRNDVDVYTNPTTYGSNLVGDVWPYSEPPYYWAIRANTNDSVDFLLSFGGYVWHPLIVGANPSFTPGSIGMFVKSEDGTFGMAASFDYLRIWNSALTFPGVA